MRVMSARARGVSGRTTSWALAALWLAAIVAANEITAHFGPTASIYNAFALIGLDLATRDRLADFWGVRRWRRMALLIAAGAVLSYLLNRDAGQIALASCIAFGAAETGEAVLYYVVRRRPWLERVNIAALLGAALDSLIFPTLAFGGLMWGITFGQFVAKVAGASLWGVALLATRPQRAAPETGE